MAQNKSFPQRERFVAVFHIERPTKDNGFYV